MPTLKAVKPGQWRGGETHRRSTAAAPSALMKKLTVPKPIGRKAARGDVLIQWDEGHEGVYPARMLRLACPCAASPAGAD